MSEFVSDGPRAAEFRASCLDLAARKLRMPIGADLVLDEQDDPEAVRLDGPRLGEVIIAAARRYETPQAMPLMDLRVEKRDLLRRLGVAEAELDTHHYAAPLAAELMQRAADTLDAPFDPLMTGQVDAVRHVAERSDFVPIGMVIGPFSLAIKLMSDPIMAVARAARATEHPQVVLLKQSLELAYGAVQRSIEAQAAAGARAICMCEPAASTVYISPKRLDGPVNPFEVFVMEPLERLRRRFAELDVALIFHDCGELIDSFVSAFGRRLRPALLSLGSSRNLWEDAALVPDDVVLYGNLPTKHFYDDTQLPVERVEQLVCDLLSRMAASGHPFILGSECDVLAVSDTRETIVHKVDRMLKCDCGSA